MLLATPRVLANVLVNGDFEAPAILLPGQSQVGPGQSKLLVEGEAVPGFESFIHSIPSWINSYSGGVRDAGLRRIDFSGSGTSQYAFINNWETRLSQVSSISVSPNYSYKATIDVGMGGASKGGKFQLWAGRPSVANPDDFEPGAILLGEITVGSAGWNGFVPDTLVPINQWTTVTIYYFAPNTGSVIGKPLTVSCLTSAPSKGPIWWDNASLIEGISSDPPTDAISREVSIYNNFASTIPTDAISREVSLFNHLSLNSATDANSREVSVFNNLTSTSATDAISREVSLLNYLETSGLVYVIWTGLSGTESYSNPGNWNPSSQVPINNAFNEFNVTIPTGFTVHDDWSGFGTVTDLTLAPGANLILDPGRVLLVRNAANIGGLLEVGNATFMCQTPVASFIGDAAQLRVTDSGALRFSATNYVGRGAPYNSELFSASGGGTILDLSSLESFDDGWDDEDGAAQFHTVVAGDGALLDLSGLQSLITPAQIEDRIDFIAETSGALRLGAFQSITGAALARFIARDGGSITADSMSTSEVTLIEVLDSISTISIEGDFELNAGSLLLASGASLSIGGDFVNHLSNETQHVAHEAILQLNGQGNQQLEVAGVDFGPTDPGNEGNFGLAQLLIGELDHPTTVELLDGVDNGNRGENAQPEALYLFGIAGLEGYVVANGSTLITHGLKVYFRDEIGQWIDLDDLIGGGRNMMNLNGGVVMRERPGDCNCDRILDMADVTYFAEALVDSDSFASAHPVAISWLQI
ncbi:MAG: hypothetical protein IPK83_17095 [Planctomycetes bacterium]|nr:hypothetical protein [Planctomycetota bacterium]